MVPSLTESLLEAGVKVIGRTRYCVHPANQVKNIAVVGGTKDISWEMVKALKADLLILDQEENPKAMSEDAPIPFLATHVRNVADMPSELKKIASRLQSISLQEQADRWQKVLVQKSLDISMKSLPGVIEWIKTPTHENEIKKIVYVIWHNPWMAAAPQTFIGSVLTHLGLREKLAPFVTPYPQLNLELFNPQETLLLFSSEPFPFGKKRELIEDLPFSSAIVDGECFSWFGIRTLRFLEAAAQG